MTFQPYLAQLESIARETGWDLKQACLDVGVADTTFYRWINRTTKPREKQARAVALYMQQNPVGHGAQ